MDRAAIPELIFTEGPVSIYGLVKELPKTGVLLKETKPEKLENWEFVNEETYTDRSELSEEEAEEYRACLMQAFEHGICLSFNCWSIDAEDRDIEP